MARIYVTPREGLSPRDPLQPAVRIPATGDWREDSPAYRRLQASGDVVITDHEPGGRLPAGESPGSANKPLKK